MISLAMDSHEWQRFPLRPYQEDSITRVLAVYRHRPKGGRALLIIPTGCGKTIIFAEVARRLALTTLVIAHRQELLQQAADKFRLIDPTAVVGQVGAGRHEYGTPITVASVQTIARPEHLHLLAGYGYGLVIIDEAHHACAAGYQAVLRSLPDACVLGVTATPDRLDKRRIEHIFGEPVYQASIIDMVEQGYLCDLRAIAVKTQTSLDNLHVQAGDYQVEELADLIDTPERNWRIVDAYREHCAGRQALCFAATVEHAGHLADAFNSLGVHAAAVSGEMPLEERKRILRHYERSSLEVVCNCLDDKTEVLTCRGWVTMETIQPDDFTATINSVTCTLEWQPISRIVRRRRQPGEQMVRIKNQTLDMRVTGGHRMMVRSPGAKTWSFVAASTLPSRKGPYELPLSAEESHPGVSLTDDELEFLGIFATDGSLNRKRASIEITQAAKSPMCIEIERVLTGCGFDWKCSEHTYTTTKGVGTYRRYWIPKGNIKGQLARKGWGRLEVWIDKSLSPRLARCTRSQFVKLLKGLWIGDGLKDAGNTRPKSSIAICGVDWVMFDRIQAWAATRGFASNLSVRPNTGGGVLGYLRIRDSQLVRTNNHLILTSGGNPATFEREWRDEEVWCVTNANGTILTRRNGHVAAMGQCSLLTEGYDSPETSCIILARPTQSRALLVQMIGRGTRLAPGKRDCIILDVTDNCLKHSLEPQTLGSALGASLVHGESVKESLQRAQRADDERGRERQQRTLVVSKRTQDLAVNILARLDWHRQKDDSYLLRLGTLQHCIMLIPSEERTGYYEVWAKLAPTQTAQQWLDAASLDWAQQYAERQARILLANPASTVLVDRTAPWRRQPVDPASKQAELLRRFNIPMTATMTKGEASDLLTRYFAERDRRRIPHRTPSTKRGA